jgi:hypothetical protein
MAIARACLASGTPHFPRTRSAGGAVRSTTSAPGSLAEVAELLGDSKRIAAAHYVYALVDYREVERGSVLERVRAVRT